MNFSNTFHYASLNCQTSYLWLNISQVRFIYSYLKEKKQNVKINKIRTTLVTIFSGVP